MKKNKRIIFIITCFVFVMSYSSLSGTAGFNRQLNVLVDENNLSYEDIKQLISEVNRIESIKYDKQLKKELKRIERQKEKEKEKKSAENKFFIGNRDMISNFSVSFIGETINNVLKTDVLSIGNLKREQNNLRLIE